MPRLCSDPLYVTLCEVQECFRARLSPKAWRLHMANMEQVPPMSRRQATEIRRSFSRNAAFLAAIGAFFAFEPGLCAENNKWREVDKGLQIAAFESPRKSALGDSMVTVVRIDPEHYTLILFCALEYGKRKRTAKEWCQDFGLVCAINACMYREDGLTPVAYMRHKDRIINPHFTKDKTVIAFNPANDAVPAVQIIDLEHQNFNRLEASYGTLVQNIRVISRKGRNVWSQQPRIWSMSVMGMDKSGNILFVFTRSPYSVHDFADILLALPLNILNATYLDGGPPASLYLSRGKIEMNLFGSYETGVREDDDAVIPWRIPNAIGVVKK